MTDTVDVDPASLTEHADAVRSFMGELQAATADAADHIDPLVWGIVNEPTAAVVGLWIDSAARFLGQVIEAGNAVAGAVDGMATEYREQEEANKSRFQGIHATLEGGR